MLDNVDKPTRFISKLVRMSQEGRIRWSPDEKGGFTSVVNGRTIRVFVNENSPRPIGLLQALPISMKVNMLELYDDFGRVAYTFTNVSGLGDLLESASYSASRVDDFMESVLAS